MNSKKVKKPRTDRSTPISQHAYGLLETAKNLGHKKIDFASAAITAYAREKLGSAVPLSPEALVDARLDYLERAVSEILWETMCKGKPNLAKSLKRLVAEISHCPYSRDFAKLNQLRNEKGKGAADDTEWVTVAFALKFGFTLPGQE